MNDRLATNAYNPQSCKTFSTYIIYNVSTYNTTSAQTSDALSNNKLQTAKQNNQTHTLPLVNYAR